MNDRKCPFTGDGSHPMTPVSMLDFRHDAYDGTCPKAVGAAAPIASQEFYDLVDEILIEGGWAYKGGNNTIDERYDPCDEAARINIIRNKFDPNPYYNDVMEWREANNLSTDDEVTACDEDLTPPADIVSTNGDEVLTPPADTVSTTGEESEEDNHEEGEAHNHDHDHDHDHSSEKDSGALTVESSLYAATAAMIGSVLFL